MTFSPLWVITTGVAGNDGRRPLDLVTARATVAGWNAADSRRFGGGNGRLLPGNTTRDKLVRIREDRGSNRTAGTKEMRRRRDGGGNAPGIHTNDPLVADILAEASVEIVKF
jgi:hypothetical protein